MCWLPFHVYLGIFWHVQFTDFFWFGECSLASCTCHVNHVCQSKLHATLAHLASTFWPCFELRKFMFWDCLDSVFMLHDQIMHALYSYRSLRMPSFEFRGSSHASGAILPCFGAVQRHVLVLKFACLHIMFHALPCFGRVAFMPQVRSSVCVHACTHVECLIFI